MDALPVVPFHRSVRRRGFHRFLCAVLVCIPILGGGWVRPASAQVWSRAVTGLGERSAQIFDTYARCVVGIDVPAQTSSDGSLLPVQFSSFQARSAQVPRRGTGFVVDAAGYVATTQRLFDGLATDGVSSHLRVSLVLENDTRVSGRLWAIDQLARVAIVKSDMPFPTSFEMAETSPNIGEVVFTLTRPYDLPTSLYVGTVNGKDRRVHPGPVERLLQTSLPVYPGAPGSPVLNEKGLVVGLLQDTLHDEPAISFALATPRLKRVVQQLIAFRTPERGCLGITVTALTPENCAQYRLEPDCQGAVVVEVYPGSPAEKAGILPDDVIARVNNLPVNQPDDLVYEMYEYRPGDQVKITYRRGDESYTSTITLDRFPQARVNQ